MLTPSRSVVPTAAEAVCPCVVGVDVHRVYVGHRSPQWPDRV